jgi:excisionase family DNA binding protein
MANIQEVPMPSKPLLTTDEFIEGMGFTIGRSSVYEFLRAGKIRHLKVGRKILILASELAEFPQREAKGTP